MEPAATAIQTLEAAAAAEAAAMDFQDQGCCRHFQRGENVKRKLPNGVAK